MNDSDRFQLTPAVRRALALAETAAAQSGSSEVEPRHLLHALVQEEEGLAASALQRAGVPLQRVRSAVLQPAQNEAAANLTAALKLASSTQEIFDLAAAIGLEIAGHRTVGGDHLMLALVRRDADLRRQLENLGLDCERLEESALAQIPVLRLDEPLQLESSAERMNVDRILDAEANRAAEALRVVEDYCRFVLDDAFLTRQIKQMRHDLVDVLVCQGNSALAARDTLADVGTGISTPREWVRHSAIAVVQANLKRLQEALRSLEEYSKLSSPARAQRLEELRYNSYTLERTIVLGHGARERLSDARLHVLISGSQCKADLEWTIAEAAAGGAQIFQLREKNLSDRELLERARRVRKATTQASVLFIMNDRPDIAHCVGADGVHLGQDDLPIKEARRIVGPDVLIGLSTHTIEQVREAVLAGASYIGVGPTFPSTTKNFPGYPGPEFVRAAVTETSLPCFAIGGITLATIGTAIESGATRVAVSEAICSADKPREIAAQMRGLLDRGCCFQATTTPTSVTGLN
jgi:thiamine-phosphate pyrophosphorylase